jgi:Zn-dependent protease with chaperone function
VLSTLIRLDTERVPEYALRMWQGRRSDFVLGALGLAALGNGVLLGLTAYGFLAAALGIINVGAPPLPYLLLLGLALGIWLLVKAGQLERALRQGRYENWGLVRPIPQESGPLVDLLAQVVERSRLRERPRLELLRDSDPNAFAVGRGRDDASIVVTQGLLDLLTPEEQEAVLAHGVAHIESEDVHVVGIADAIAESIAQFCALRGNVLWGPWRIAIGIAPFALTALVFLLLFEIVPKPLVIDGFWDAMLLLAVCLFYLAAFAAVIGSAVLSFWGFLQLFFFISFFGPLTVIELALAPPLAAVLSRLLSRTRVYEADQRTEQLCGDDETLISALEKLAKVECEPDGTWSGKLRFSLLVTPRRQKGYQAWFERVWATHPSIDDRLAELREDANRLPSPARATAQPQ